MNKKQEMLNPKYFSKKRISELNSHRPLSNITSTTKISSMRTNKSNSQQCQQKKKENIPQAKNKKEIKYNFDYQLKERKNNIELNGKSKKKVITKPTSNYQIEKVRIKKLNYIVDTRRTLNPEINEKTNIYPCTKFVSNNISRRIGSTINLNNKPKLNNLKNKSIRSLFQSNNIIPKDCIENNNTLFSCRNNKNSLNISFKNNTIEPNKNLNNINNLLLINYKQNKVISPEPTHQFNKESKEFNYISNIFYHPKARFRPNTTRNDCFKESNEIRENNNDNKRCLKKSIFDEYKTTTQVMNLGGGIKRENIKDDKEKINYIYKKKNTKSSKYYESFVKKIKFDYESKIDCIPGKLKFKFKDKKYRYNQLRDVNNDIFNRMSFEELNNKNKQLIHFNSFENNCNLKSCYNNSFTSKKKRFGGYNGGFDFKSDCFFGKTTSRSSSKKMFNQKNASTIELC